MKFAGAWLCCITRHLRCYSNFRLRLHTPPRTMAERQTHVRKLTDGRRGIPPLARLHVSELPTTVRSMEEHKDGFRPVTLCRTAQRWCAVLVVCLMLHTADADADPAAPPRHFQL